MFQRIMVPVDLAHEKRLEKSLGLAADLARQYGATVIYVAISAATPGSVAHTPGEFADKLSRFATDQGKAHNIATESHAVTSHDPSIDLDPALLKAVNEIKADLVVMASHVPNITDYLWPSNGGTVASHAPVSVMVVR
ncbi:universal stress protein [Sneathiella sp.]|uniref:universal stress protein n=1 Tax=Sneathiella sp. TaxID=1964365 RepID=UPI003562CD6B